MILDQLRCSGLMEAVRVSRAGFPVRILHADFLRRFSLLRAPPAASSPKEAAARMFMIAGIILLFLNTRDEEIEAN